MILGFYYHSTFIGKQDAFCVPGYIGVYIDSLATQVDSIYLFLEEQTDPNSTEEDYRLTQPNIKLVSLGPKSTFYKRLLAPRSKTSIILQYANQMDAFLVRCPSPLAPHIVKTLSQKVPCYPMLVGNYVNGLKDLEQPLIRKLGIIMLTYFYQYLQHRMVSRSHLFVNSGALYEENKKRAKTITLIKTTTLTSDSFYNREDTCSSSPIKLLFTGRINFQKGLRELIEATALLKDRFNLEIHIVGWEEKGAFSYVEALKNYAIEKGIQDRLFFHGKKQIGPELNAYYRNSDIYVIPSYHEGFPRTIWEAMANSMPVIATSVGSIPYYLNHNENAILIEPRNTEALVEAISEVISNSSLRKKIIENAYLLTQDITLEKQSYYLIQNIKSYNNE